MSDDTSLFIRLYLDADVHKRIATALRLQHFDVISAHETDRLGASDDTQLQFAAEHGRTLFTFNTSHSLHLHLERGLELLKTWVIGKQTWAKITR